MISKGIIACAALAFSAAAADELSAETGAPPVFYAIGFLADVGDDAPLADRLAYWRAQAAMEGFAAVEARLREDGDASDLAALYASEGLFPEALAALDAGAVKNDPWINEMRAYAFHSFGRDEDVLSRTQESATPFTEALRAMSLARLGAYGDARRHFRKAAPPDAGFGELRNEFYLLRTESAIAAKDAESARTSLVKAKAAGVEDRRAYLAARIDLLDGDGQAAQRAFGALAAAAQPVAGRAQVADLWRALKAQSRDPLEIFTAAQAASFGWTGGALEREAGFLAGAAAAAAGKYDAAFAAYRRLVYHAPKSDLALEAQAAMTRLLTVMFEKDAGAAPLETAQLFYDNIEFAPTGRAGDAMIRDVTQRLLALDLNDEAAELMHHQVFERLRGEDRAGLAADLASIYMREGRANDALETIRTTRIAGLAEALVERRRLIEAEALAETDRRDAAIVLLENADGVEALYLRAEIYWRAEEWPLAAKAYASAFSAETAPLDARARHAALRAAAAYILGDDDEAFAAFAQEAGPRLDGHDEEGVIDALAKAPGDIPAFLESYAALFKEARAPS